MTIDARRERRHHNRLSLPASAILFLDGVELGHYIVQDLCAGGALLTGSVATTMKGDVVQVLLHLPGQPPLEIDACVRRMVDTVGHMVAVGIEFEHEDAFTEDAIQEALLGALDPDYVAKVGRSESDPELDEFALLFDVA